MSSFQYNQTLHSLKELHQTLHSPATLTLTTPLSIIQTLVNNLPTTNTNDSINHLNLSLFLDHQYSIWQFLKVLYKNAELFSDKVWIRARMASFDLLNHLLKLLEGSSMRGPRIRAAAAAAHSNSSLPHESLYLKVVDLCIFSYRRDTSNTVKKSILSPLVLALEYFFLDPTPLKNSNYPVRRIYEIFYKDLMKGKASIGVKSELLKFLCQIMNVFPGELREESKRMFRTCMEFLHEQSVSQSPERMIIAKTFLALKYLLYSFSDNMGEEDCKTLYLYIIKALEQMNDSRHDLPKAALKLIGAHAILFKTFVYRDAIKLYDRLEQLCDHRNAEVRKTAFPALEAVLGVLSQALSEESTTSTSNSGGETDPTSQFAMRIFETMMGKFKELLAANRRHTKYSMGTAICSIGAFAQPMRKFLGEQDTQKILYKLFEYGDQLLSKGEEDSNENLYHLPSFISAFANIILVLDSLEMWIFDYLDKFMAFLFVNFPKQYLYPKLRYKTYMCFIRLLVALSFKEDALNKFLGRVFFQCLTMAVVPRKDATDDDDFEVKQYEQYLDLWIETLKPSNYLTITWIYPWSAMPLEEKDINKIHCAIYDQVMMNIMQMTSKLDVRVQLSDASSSGESLSNSSEQTTTDDSKAQKSEDTSETTFEPSDITSHIRPSNPRDFSLHLNLVAFHIHFMRKTRKKFMWRWVNSLSKYFTEKSLSSPYVSGFYEVLTQVMKISSSIGYFSEISDDTKLSKNAAQNSTMEKDPLFSAELSSRVSSFHDIQLYCKLTLKSLHQFKGELLSSVIQLLLSVPLHFMDSESFVIPLMLAFEQGMSYLPLAKIGLNTLESWIDTLSPEKLQSCLSRILPCLNQYLSFKDQHHTEEQQRFNIQTKKTMISIHDSSESEREKKLQKNMFDEADLTPLKDIQLRIIRLLAKLGGENHAILNEDPKKFAERIMSWDSQSKILFNIPFRDIKPELYLDSLLPRVTELAESSGDRRTKVAACEFLHSLMLYMIGTNAIDPNARKAASDEESKPTRFFKIYSHLFPVLIRLAVDNDQVTRQLFEPFIYQIIHWFTQNMEYEHKETMALLDCIVEGLCHEHDAAVRDLCASLLHEFLKWSVKHDTSKKYHNVKSLFQRLYSHACHPNMYKRLGAIVAFNRMYRGFREVSALVDHHVLDWLHMSVKSLKMSSQQEEEDKFLVRQTIALLRHVEKIIVFRSSLLLETKIYRGYHPDLYDAVQWLFKQCGTLELHARRECMRLFTSFCMCLPEYASESGPSKWVQNTITSTGEDRIIDMVEFDHNDPFVMLKTPNVTSKVTLFTEWLSHLASSLDTYTWLFSHNLIDARSVLTNKKSTLVSDVIIFLQKICLNTIQKLLSVTLSEEKVYNRMRTQVTTAVLRFVICLVKKDTVLLEELFQSILNRYFFLPLLLATTHPSRLGFDSLLEEKRLELFTLVDSVYKTLSQSTQYISRISTILAQISTKPGYNVLLFDVMHSSDTTIDEATIWFRGLRLLCRRGILTDSTLPVSKHEFSAKLLKQLADSYYMMNPTQLAIAEEMMEMSFEVGDANECLLSILSDSELAAPSLSINSDADPDEAMTDDDGTTTGAQNSSYGIARKFNTKSAAFYRIFNKEIIAFMSKNLDFFVQRLATLCVGDNPFFFSILLDLATHFMKNSKNRPEFMSLVVKNSYLFTDKFFSSSLDFRLNVVHLFEKIRFVSDSLFDSEQGQIEKVVQIYLTMIRTTATQDSTFPLSLKLESMQAIPDLLSSPFSSKVLEACKNIVDNEFPITPEELSEDSSEFDKYVKLLDSMLHSMQVSANVNLFRILLGVFRWVNHPLRRRMNRSMEGMFEKLTNDNLLLIANECFQHFQNVDLPQSYRCSLVQWVTITCISKMGQEALKQYFKEHITQIVDMVKKEITTALLSDQKEVVSMTCAYDLLETMFRILPSAAIKKEINTEYCRKLGQNVSSLKGNELISTVMRAALAARKSNVENYTVPRKMVLSLRQSSYNVLAGAVMCTQTKEKHFIGFLFKSQHGDLWDHIVDKDKKLEFEIETNFDIYTQAINKLRIEVPSTRSRSENNHNRMAYLSTQYLTDSSLSGDLPYLGSFYIPGSSYSKTADNTDDDGDILMADADDIMDEKHEKISTVETNTNSLEMDHINKNPCMPTLLRVIDFMHKTFSSAETASVMPQWMKMIFQTLNDRNTHKNIKFFLAKVIVNRPKIFEPFCHSFFEPLVSVATTALENNRGIHYFVRDICILLLRWEKLDPGETLNGRAVATSLVEFLMKHTASKKRVILRHNLELLKLLVEKWKPFLRIDKKIILGWICFDASHSSSELARITGLQIIGVLVANDIPAYDSTNDSHVIEEQRFYECIVNNLTQRWKRVFEAAAEICGMILKFLSSQMTDDSGSYDLFDQLVTGQCMLLLSQNKYDQFLNVLSKICMRHVSIVDHFLPTKLLDMLPKLFGINKKTALQLISRRAEHFTDMYIHFQPYVKPNLERKEEPIQLLTLQIIHKVAPQFNAQFLQQFLEIVQNCSSSLESAFREPCRIKYFEVLIWVFDNRKDLEKSCSESLRTALLQGLSDSSELVRRMMLEFWDHESRLSIESIPRLEQLFKWLYSPQIGQRWLQHSSHLLLQLTHRSPDFENTKALFAESLAKCEFKNYDIDTSFRSLPSTLLMTQTMQANKGKLAGEKAQPEAVQKPGQVLATQANSFSMTMQNYSAEVQSLLSDSSLTTSSLLFVPFKKTNGKPTNGATTTATNSSTQSSFERKKLRRRFTSLKEATMVQTHIRRSMRIKKEREAWSARQKMKRHTKLNLYRTYRTGELPDIQIALRELIVPLQALCMADVQTAKVAFVAIANAMFSHLYSPSSKYNQKSVNKLLQSVATQILAMVEESKDDSVLINALWNLCLQYPALQMGLSETPLVNASIGSYNAELGILVYENMLNRSMGNIMRMMRKAKSEEDHEAIEEQQLAQYEAFVRLARLYGELGEDDIVRGIFENHCSHHEVTKKALEFERIDSYKEALKQYTLAIEEVKAEQDEVDEEVTFWEFQSLKCLRQLTQWDNLSEKVTSHICGDPPVHSLQQVWEMEHRDFYLPLLMESYIKTPAQWRDLVDFVNESNDSEEKRQVLNVNLSHRLSTIDLIGGDSISAKVHIMDGFAHFIHKWSCFSVLSKENRYQQLQLLQPQIESEEFIALQHAEDKVRSVMNQVKKWNSRYPSAVLDDVPIWDDVITNRSMIYDGIEKMLSKSNLEAQTKSSVMKEILGSKAALLLRASKAVQNQNNLQVSQKYLKQFQSVWKALHKQDSQIYGTKEPFNFTFFESLVHLFLLKGNRQSNVQTALSHFSKVVDYMRNNRSELQAETLDHIDPVTKRVRFDSMFARAFFDASKRAHEAGVEDTSLGNVDGMLGKAFENYQSACERASQSNVKAEDYVSAFQEMASFCDHVLQNGLHSEDASSPLLANNLANHAVKYHLLSMKFHADSARMAVPHILKYIELHPASREYFTAHWKSVPHWMYLAWISQMIPHLNGSQGDYIIDVIQHLATQYPQGVYFPWSISESDLDPKNERVKQSITRIGKTIHNPQMDRFVRELDRLTNPSHRWSMWVKKLQVHMKNSNLTLLKETWKECFDDLFDTQREQAGAFNQKFAEIWTPHIKKEFGGRHGDKLLSMSSKRFARAINSISSKMKKSKKQNPVGKSRLSHFSPYLADFQASKDVSKCMVLPGQYEMIDRDPNILSLTMISSFDPIILVLGSIRRPKRLTIHGNDEKDYNFLVKGGEDLRQDQRIEQMFMLMNDVLKKNTQTQKRNLRLNTYRVVPMTKDVGVLEWVDNTTPIKSLVEQDVARVTKNPKGAHLLQLEPATYFDQMLNKTSGSAYTRYLKSYRELSRKVVTQYLLKEYQHIRKDHFKNALISLAASQEAFFMIRSRFGKSLSVFNICSYLLGIGDRHLDNFLLDCTSGEVVGIDFGHAFGSATEVLPVPELVPFRLTRQFVEVFTPLTTSHEIAIQRNTSVATGGIFLENMTHTLSALRQEKDKLISCMEIFVREPLVDWLNNVKNVNNNSREENDSGETSSTMTSNHEDESLDIDSLWYPDKKLTLAKRKLDLWNPTHILEHDLNSNAHLKKLRMISDVVKVAHGDPKYNIRARVRKENQSDKCVDERQQVECLIDLACDPSVLQRIYMGWAPYV